MPSTFFGLQIGAGALAAQQMAVDVTGHNIANASNPNYTRQVANFVAAPPYTFPIQGQDLTLGEGVNLGSVTRARDAFVDTQYRNQNSLLSYWTQKQDGANKIQGVMNEPTDNSLSGALNAFWSDWSTLANNAQDSAARTTVQQQAVTLAGMFKQISGQITDLQNTYQLALTTAVSQINTIAQQISQLNIQINQAEVNKTNANDLMDQRDSLVDQLSQYYKVTVVQTQNGAISNYEVKIGSYDLVNSATYNTLAYKQTPSINNDVTWATVSTPSGSTQPTSGLAAGSGDGAGGNTGSIKGNIDNLIYLAQIQEKYDNLAQGIADAVNQMQNQGIDMYGNAGSNTASGNGQSFFTYSTNSNPNYIPGYISQGAAASLQMNGNILNDPNKIAAADPSGGEVTAGTASLTVGSNTYTIDVAAGATLASVLNALQKKSSGAFTYTITGNQITLNPAGSITFGSGSDTSNALQVLGLSVPQTITGPTTTTTTASSTDILANGSNAQSIANLKNGWSDLEFTGSPSQLVLPSGANPANPVFTSVSLSDYYGSLVSGVGVEGQKDNNIVSGQQALVNNLSNQRQSYSGVSIDEEMTNMIMYQKSYTAAARVITMMDDLLNTIVSGLGITR